MQSFLQRKPLRTAQLPAFVLFVMGSMAGHCLQFWFSKLLGNTSANGHRSMHRYGWLETNLNWCPKDCLLLYFSPLSKQVQTTKQPILSHSQIPNHSSSQSNKAQALLSHTAFHEHPHRCKRVGLLHATLMETTITARIAALEHTRFPRSEQHLPGTCPRVQHMNAYSDAKRVRCISSKHFFCLLRNFVSSYEAILSQADNPHRSHSF